MSPKSAGLAKELGYKNVRVYQDGTPDWNKAGQTMVTNVPALKKLISGMDKTPDQNPFFVLLDVRSSDDAAKGFIPLATAMSADDVAKRSAEFPQYKTAQIIVYAQNEPTPDALKALKELHALKFSNAAILWGGFDAWKKAEGKVASGRPADKIKFTRKVAEDEISVAEFKDILVKKPGTKLVVDVRPPEEFNQGAIQGVKSVPLEVMQKDLSDLPKDKEIITFCNTGAICSIADKLLKKEGFKSRYLNATVTYQDGKPVITE
jgi:rhodanese-related sulfurtransferase